MRQIYMESEGTQLLEGVCDIHMYALPSVFPTRYLDEIELARQARDVGYKAVLVKEHHTTNADRAQTINKLVPDIHFFGGIVLNHYVGGLNPFAVEAAIRFGAKEVWMPNVHSAYTLDQGTLDGYSFMERSSQRLSKQLEPKGISILDSKGAILDVVYDILELIAEADIILGTAHISLQEAMLLIRAAKEVGVKKIVVTHPEGFPEWTLESQMEAAELGAFLEHNVVFCLGDGNVAPATIAKAIKHYGASHGVMASGLGNKEHPHPIDGMRIFIQLMLRHGISQDDIDVMTKHNPRRLLDL